MCECLMRLTMLLVRLDKIELLRLDYFVGLLN